MQALPGCGSKAGAFMFAARGLKLGANVVSLDKLPGRFLITKDGAREALGLNPDWQQQHKAPEFQLGR